MVTSRKGAIKITTKLLHYVLFDLEGLSNIIGSIEDVSLFIFLFQKIDQSLIYIYPAIKQISIYLCRLLVEVLTKFVFKEITLCKSYVV